ncbi:hypothetical protein [Mucilaginibacter pedocola]|uniref:Uncharacterized protein n=1 Tax=Mucilaginibacter pedocola TaxID=1792845 RepID=A0A1S9PDD2_9SPHI|nr:hypothetical protein [Mucilaginibacter pedocola]OOQ58984.1 hypothetical protein BC343_29935 [Mucilaginibacter pedocola]
MKKILLGMFASCALLAASVTQSKAQISVNVNIGTWTPPVEYTDVQYVYLPDIESYYYVPQHQYVYMDGGSWVFRNAPPQRYAGYNINNGYKVIVNRPRAYQYFSRDKVRYARYRGSSKQVIVRGNSYVAPRNNYVRKTKVVRIDHRPPGPRAPHGPGPGHGPGRGPAHGHGNGHGHH